MKTNLTLQSLAIFIGVALLACANSARGQVYAYDDASGYTGAAGNAAWLFSTTTNGGYGFTPWVFTKVGSDYQGFYVGNPSGISTNGNAWGMYANGPTANDAAAAYRGFSNSMPVNAVFTIRWSNHGIGGAGHQGGFSLRNGNANASTADTETGTRFDFYYIGGGQNSFSYQDGNGPAYIGLPFNSGPFQVEFTLLTADTYRFVVKDATGVNVITNIDNQPLGGSPGSTIDSVALYALQTDGDQVFNRMAIYSSSLVPPSIAIVSPTNGSVYLPTSTPITFNVISASSGVSSNNVKLALNGVNVTNLSFSGSTASWAVTATPVLADNTTYNGTIIAIDANGNHATNTFTFNTWRSDNPFIEASDYNHNSGNFPDPAFPDVFDSLFGAVGTSNVDYLEYDTTPANIYRPGDTPQIEYSGDTVDHAGYLAGSYPTYDLGYIKRYEWENYTRVMSNKTYSVYARMAGFGGNNPTMLLEHLANPTATTTDQPRSPLGSFVCPSTGGASNYTMVQLKDFFSNPVEVNFASTTTFRCTSLADDGSYNFAYLIFVPSTNVSTLRPYLSSGFPYPKVTGVQPDQVISFTIANRQTSVNPATIRLFLNSNEVTSGITLSNNAAGTVVNYVSPSLFASNSTNTLTAIFADNAGSPVSSTNTWQFFVVTYQLVSLPSAYALPAGSIDTAPGFSIRINKARDDAPTTDFPSTLARVEKQLDNNIIDNSISAPYVNLATNNSGSDLFAETNTINYDIAGVPTGSYTFPSKSPFPYIAASGTNNFIAMEALMYLQLAPGIYKFAVRSDDGFQLSAGPTPGNTNTILALYDGGRGNGTPTTFFFTAATAGLYPMRLLYCQGEFSGNIEFYSIDHLTGAATLINDPSNPSSIKAFQGSAVLLLNPAHSGSSSSFSFTTLAGHTHVVQYKNALTDLSWTSNQTITGNGSLTNVVDSTASGAGRFYRVVTQ